MLKHLWLLCTKKPRIRIGMTGHQALHIHNAFVVKLKCSLIVNQTVLAVQEKANINKLMFFFLVHLAQPRSQGLFPGVGA